VAPGIEKTANGVMPYFLINDRMKMITLFISNSFPGYSDNMKSWQLPEFPALSVKQIPSRVVASE
jgi:hypothetical protein